jgi:bifunctional non-homologous end joining protein LigD
MSLRFPVEPMKATLGSLPRGEGWAYEIKWDGYRTVAHVADGAVRLQSASGKDVTARWPELAPLAAAVNARSAILDTELVVFDAAGAPRFELVQRSGVGSGLEGVLQLFDVLSIDGTDTIALPYEHRRRLLADLIEPGDNWALSRHVVGDGADLLDATFAQGFEGVMAKRLDSIYRPGTRSKDWRKVKNRRPTEVTIGGYTAGSGTRSSTFGAVLVGLPVDDGTLRFAGGVGTGFDQATLDSLTARFATLRTSTCPFVPPPPAMYRRHATWLAPELRASIEIAEFTNEGYVRHASFLHLLDR